MDEATVTDGALVFDEQEQKTARWFWAGFIIYSLSYAISTSGDYSFIICQAVQCVGLVLLLPAAISLIKSNIENEYLKAIYILYCGWLVLVIVRGFAFNYEFLKDMLFNAWFGIFLYFVPLVLLFPARLAFYKTVFTVIIILGLAAVFFDALFIKALLNPQLRNLKSQGIVENFSKTLAIPCGFILLTYIYHSLRTRFIALGILLLTFLFAAIRARRGLMFMAVSPMIFFYFIYNYVNRGSIASKIFSILLISAIAAFGFKVYNENRTGVFNSITQRIDDDTRTGVEIIFYADMKTDDWILGRGVNGKYYCPGINSFDSVYRSTIETDYLQIILKGGLISLGLLLLIAVPAIFKGLFASQNTLSKAAAIWILLWLVDLYPANVTTFTLNYILVWLSIGICYSNEIRNIPESTMKEYFRSKMPTG